MNYTSKSLLSLALLLVAFPAIRGMDGIDGVSDEKVEEGSSKKEETPTKNAATGWKATLTAKLAEARKFTGDHPIATTAVGLGLAGAVGFGAYKKSERVKKAVDNSYAAAKKRALAVYDYHKQKGLPLIAAEVGLVAGLSYGLYRANKSYGLVDSAKSHIANGWTSTKNFFVGEEGLWNKFNGLSTTNKMLVGAGAAAGAGLAGWLSWKAYKAYKGHKAEVKADAEIPVLFERIRASLTDKQKNMIKDVFEVAKTDATILMEPEFYTTASQLQQMLITELIFAQKKLESKEESLNAATA